MAPPPHPDPSERPAPSVAERGDPGPPRVPPIPLVIGVLGGIASGKSLVAELLAGPGGRVIAADRLAREALASPEGRAWLTGRFGPDALGPDGLPDRARIAALVFDPVAGAEARRALEGWTHPRVRARILEELREARADGVARVALDVPLLLENDAQHGLARLCDVLVFVDADPGVRERRARLARGWAPGEVGRREAAQLPLDAKRQRADFVLSNNGNREELERAAARLVAELTAR